MHHSASQDRSRFLLVRSLWLVAAAMVVHELEEWNIAAWGARNFTNHTGISNYAIWIGLFIISAVLVIWIYCATRFESPLAISLIALPAVALVAAGNAFQHVTWTILFSEYAPGVVSAVVLVLPASVLSMWRMFQVSRMLLVPIGACAALWIAASVQIIEAGNVMQPFQVVLQRFFISLTSALGLPGVAPG
jgi:hypothetical protein